MANFNQIFQDIKKEFSEEVAINAVIALALNFSFPVKKKDLQESGRYTRRLNEHTKDILWETKQEVVDLAIKLRELHTQVEISKTLGDIGGSGVKTYKELLEKS